MPSRTNRSLSLFSSSVAIPSQSMKLKMFVASAALVLFLGASGVRVDAFLSTSHPVTPTGMVGSSSVSLVSSSSLRVSFPSAFPDDLGGGSGSAGADNNNNRNMAEDRQHDDPSSCNHNNRHTEFINLGSVEESSRRVRRMEEESRIEGRFIRYGDELWALRRFMTKLSHKLIGAVHAGLHEREDEIREQLRQVEQQDPELVYRMELEALHSARREGRDMEAREHGRNAYAARSCLPQYNLDGLWVGKYGHHGYEMVNVTYQGDLLIAYKVTGDKNVPRGEITFQVDLSPVPLLPRSVGGGSFGGHSPSRPTSAVNEPLQPIYLTDKAARKWGTTQLPRHKGLGQVAELGFTNNQWMEGQLIIIGEEYFSFAWVPIEQQIFFGRPSPELALKMLRDSGAASDVAATGRTWAAPPSMDADVQVLKDYVTSCLERTTEGVEEGELSGDPLSCIWSGMETEECYFQ